MSPICSRSFWQSEIRMECLEVNSQRWDNTAQEFDLYLVGGWAIPLQHISQLGWLFPIYGKMKNDPNHKSVMALNLLSESKRRPAMPCQKPPYLKRVSNVHVNLVVEISPLLHTLSSLNIHTTGHIFASCSSWLIGYHLHFAKSPLYPLSMVQSPCFDDSLMAT